MNQIHSLVVIVFIAFSQIPCIWGACNFTSDLTGQWYSTSFGTLNFTYNKFAGFTSGISSTPLTFTCYLASGSRYVSKTSYSLFIGFNVDVYLCMDLVKVSSIKYYFTLNSDLYTSEGLRFYSPATSGSNVTMNEACARTDNRSPGEYELLIKKSNISAAVSTCPTSLQSNFSVTMSTSSVSNCAGTRLVGSEDALSFNYSSCVKGSLSSFGHLRCLYSKTDTYTYVTLYDNSTSASHKFTCMVYEKIEGTLKATEYPGSCQHNQTPTAVTTPGVTYVMTDLSYVASEDKKADYTVVIIVVCVIGGLLIIAIIVIVVYIKVCRKPTLPESPKPRKPKRKLSVTEYHPKILGRSLSNEKTEGVLCKQSTEEILTGVLEGKKNKSSTLNSDAYEPPKKEAWQKKWEKNPTRSNAQLFQKMKQNFPSDGGISKLEELSALELDKAYTMSTSLPESLDFHSNKPSAKPKEKSPGKVPETQKNLASPKYTEKFHASSSIPQSTGKFGGSPRIRSFDTIPLPGVEPKLDPITENPFSRENTKASLLRKGTPVQQLKETSKSPRLYIGDALSISTVVVSPGTASVGDITFQNSFKNISRVSHLSASSASIFDDPGWLLDNKLNADVTFDRMQNLQASVPKPKDKDPKWFLSTPKKPEISREDMDFFRSRSKSNAGINKRKWSSLEIIAQELKRRQDAKTTKTKKPKTVKTKYVRPKNQHSED